MTSDRTFLQSLAHEVVQFFEFVIPGVAEGLARQAIIRDLGGTADLQTGTAQFPQAQLDSIRAYRDAAEPGVAADLEVVQDIAALLDAIAANVETWNLGPAQGPQELGHSLLDLFATNWVRHRLPRVFLFLQAIKTLEDTSSTFGAGDSSGERLGRMFASFGQFLASPGRSLDDLDAANEHVDPGGGHGIDIGVDTTMRLAATVMGVLDGLFEITLIGDTLVGWDAVGLDIDSDVEPTRADVISSRMISFSVAHDSDRPEDQNKDAERLQLSLLYLPKRSIGPEAQRKRQFFVAFGGAIRLDSPITPRWTFSVNLRSDAGVAALLGGGPEFEHFRGIDGDGNFSASVGWTSKPDQATGFTYAIPRPTGTRLEIGTLSLSLTLASTGAQVRAELGDAALVIDSNDHDGFMRTLLGSTPLRLPFGLVIGYDSATGRIVQAKMPQAGGPTGAGVQNSPIEGTGAAYAPIFAAVIPLGRHFGPVTIHEIALQVSHAAPTSGGSDVTAVEATISFSAQLGVAYFRVDRLGLALVADTSKPHHERNLRFVDLHLGAKPPLGIGVNVDTSLISGGGTIFHDPVQGIYFGALTLRIKTRFLLKAIGLVSTRNPDGTPGSSFIIIATLEGLGWQIGPVTLDGLGVLYASERTFDENAMRAALPTGQLRNVLFPTDPVHHTTETLQALSAFFPARPGSTLIGLLVKLVFGRLPIVRLDLALIYQFGPGVSDRLIVLGRVSSILPDEGARLVQLNLDAVGIFDPSAGVAALDAVLVDSKIAGRFPLTGAAAFRRVPGGGGFALAVGGFHPQFRPPDGFPALPRITVALTSGDNPKLICTAYLAITSNTIQFGAEASLYAAACGFSIAGDVGFDVLIQLIPFHFLADFRASVQLKRGSHNLFKVSVEGALEGPLPLRVSGKATFEILWCDFSVSFDATLLGGSTQQQVPSVDALAALTAQLGDVRNWQAEPPGAASRLVTLRRETGTSARVVAHPLGTLTVSQGVVPLNLSRDIDRVGAAVPSGGRRFTITQVRVGADPIATSPARDQFAPAQFFDLTDDEKLAAPSFEQMESGVSFGDVDYSFDAALPVNAPFEYTDITIDANGSPVVASGLHTPDGGFVLTMLRLGAAAQAPVRLASGERFDGPASSSAPSLRAGGWTVADPTSGAPVTPVATWAEAHAQLAGRILVPTTELTE